MGKKNKALELINLGSEIVGATTPIALSLLNSNSLELFCGATIGVLVKKGIDEMAERKLSSREKIRAGAAIALVISGIKNNLDNGLELRQDNFFDDDTLNRSKANELFEGVIMKCKNEYEERKIQYISNIYTNVIFNSSIKPNNVNQILNTVDKLSFQQLTILALVGKNKNNQLSLKQDKYGDDEIIDNERAFLLQDFAALNSYGLIERSDYSAIFDFTSIIPGGMQLTSIGETHYELLGLSDLNIDDLDYLVNLK